MKLPVCSSRSIAVFVIVTVLTIASAIPVFCATERETDENGDGHTDQWVEVSDETTTRIRKDRDFDGVPDYELVYDERARKVFEGLDFDFDGVMDDFYYYEAGVLARRELDTDNDTRIDLWVYLSQGVYISRIERDLDRDGEADYRKDYGPEADR